MTSAIRRILLIGFATRHVASSAVRAGLEVYAIDHFCDLDLRQITVACASFQELYEIPDLARRFCAQYPIDAVITTSGAEDLSDLPIPILGTSPDIAGRFLNKALTQEFFEEHGFPVPARVPRGVFPAMIKPCKGSGGWRNALVSGEEEIDEWEALFPGEPYLLQEVAPGIPASVCCVTNGRSARSIAVNLQILRGSKEARFGFCGSVTPFRHPLAGKMRDMAEAIAAASGCQGIIGIDFLVTEDRVIPIEVNPRFVATLDTIERATGCNLVTIHLDAFEGKLPVSLPDNDHFCIRQILFAPHEITISSDLSHLMPSVADIPVPPTSFEAGDAVISVYGEGSDEASARSVLDKTIKVVSQYIG